MKSFMDKNSMPTILHLIEGVPNFKSFIERSICERKDVLVSHIKAQQLKFYLNLVGVLIMKYKHKKWLLPKGRDQIVARGF